MDKVSNVILVTQGGMFVGTAATYVIGIIGGWSLLKGLVVGAAVGITVGAVAGIAMACLPEKEAKKIAA